MQNIYRMEVETEFIACPDPTARVVLKVTRTKIGEVGPDGTPVFLENS